MPKGVRRNPFQALLDTANKQLQFARERLAAAEQHADCLHQKKLRAARTEHDEWSRMVKSLNTSLTIPQPRRAVELPTELIEDTPPLPPAANPPIVPDPLLEQPLQSPAPASKKQSNNAAGDPASQARQLIQTTPHLGGDAGDRRKQPGPHPTGRKPGRPGKVDRFDRCPGLPNRGRCLNSKPFDSELCGRCATMKNIPAVFQPR